MILFIFIFFFSQNVGKKWHRLNFYNALFSSVRRKFSSLGAKSREIKSVFRQLNKRLNFQRYQYPAFLIATRKDWNLAFLLKRYFLAPRRELPIREWGAEVHWNTTHIFFAFGVRLLVADNNKSNNNKKAYLAKYGIHISAGLSSGVATLTGAQLKYRPFLWML